MASGVEATIACDDIASATQMWQDTLGLLEHLEHCWSRFLDQSDISRLNLAGGRPVVVDPMTIALVRTMIDAWSSTAGLFDPTVLPILLASGYRTSIDDPTRTTTLPPLATFSAGGRLTDVRIDTARAEITLPDELALDPGGIGKGLAADLAVDHLLSLGAHGALVSIGGDLVARGRPPAPSGWWIAVEDPLTPTNTLCTLELDAGGVATSSTRSRRWVNDGEEQHHAIDPRHASQSMTDLATVTIIARSGWLAEAHATAALLAGSSDVLDYVELHDLSALAVTSSGRVLTTPDLRDAVETATAMASDGWFR